MATFKYEALNTSGEEVKDSIDAGNEEEASQKIKAMGYFVTKLTATAGGGKKGGKGKKKGTGKSRKTFTIGGVSNKMLVLFTRQFSTLQDAGLPVLKSLRLLEKQMKPSVLKNSLIDVVDDVESGTSLSESMGRHPKAFNRRRAGGHPPAARRVPREGRQPQAQDHRRHGLPGRGHLRRRGHPDVHHGGHHPEV